MSEHPPLKSHTARELLVLAGILKDIEIPVSFPIAAWKICVLLQQASSEIDGKDTLIGILYQRLSERPEQFAREIETLRADIAALKVCRAKLATAAELLRFAFADGRRSDEERRMAREILEAIGEPLIEAQRRGGE